MYLVSPALLPAILGMEDERSVCSMGGDSGDDRQTQASGSFNNQASKASTKTSALSEAVTSVADGFKKLIATPPGFKSKVVDARKQARVEIAPSTDDAASPAVKTKSKKQESKIVLGGNEAASCHLLSPPMELVECMYPDFFVFPPLPKTRVNPFMSSPTDLPGVFTQGETRAPVGDWHSVLMTSKLSSQCDLERMVFCKCTNNVKHEFLLLHFRHPVQRHAVAVLVLDRTLRTSLLPRLSRFCSSFGDAGICAVCVLSKHSPTYRLWQYQCYWYAHTVWEALKRLFDGCQETTLIEGCSQFWGQDIPKAESVEEVCKQYRVEWALFENVVEERRKREEEEEHRLRMEGGAQRQPEIDKERRQ
ncbi:hypothetical protein P692DRAFT_201869715 [Suillus brevipes Sb2]|nr:hypothetical protein P692DRAFT_201869715 [Suillus brevipes Sb2]